MKKIKTVFCILLCAAMLSVNVTAEKTVSSECDISDLLVPVDSTVTDFAVGSVLELKAKSAILMEVKTGKILYDMNSSEKMPPASITKIMSLLLVMEAIDRGELKLEDVIVASEHACSMGGSQIWLEPGESMTVDELLKATVIASANDATVALGEKIAGSEEGFVHLMNERAKQLGMNSTTFVNATGLDAKGHESSAHDVAVMSAELIKYPLIKKYSTVWMDTLRDGKSELVNTNKLVRFYPGTTGLKTGTTSGAGYCLSATAERDGMELVAVVMKGDTSQERFNAAKKLLDFGFANYTYKKITADIEGNSWLPIAKGVEKSVKIVPKGDFSVILKKSEAKSVTQKINLKEKVTAPVKKGDVLGNVDIYIDDEQIGSIDLVAESNIEKLNFKTALWWIIKGFFTL